MSLVFEGEYLKNFGSYVGEHTVEFRRRPGLYYVKGDSPVDDMDSNGAGKSTLFNALSWCLYGKTLRDERPGDSVEPWSDERPTVVRVAFHRDGTHYRVTRQRRPNKLILQTGAADPVECEQSAVDEAVGVPYELFRCSVMLPQFGEMFLSLTPEAQATLFSDALGLDLWLRSSTIAGSMASDVNASIEEIRSKIEHNRGRLAEVGESIAATMTASDLFDRQAAENIARIAKLISLKQSEASELSKGPKPASDAHTPKIEQSLFEWRETASTLRTASATDSVALMSLERQQREAAHAVAAYKKGAKCPECGQTVPEAHIAAKRKPLAAKLAELTSDVAKMEKQSKEDAEKLKAADAKVIQLQGEAAASRAEHEKKNAAAIKSAARLEALRSEVAGLKAEKSRAESAANPHKARLTELQRKKAEVDAAQKADEASLAAQEAEAALYESWQAWFRQIRLDVIDGCLAEVEAVANQEAERLGLRGWRMKIATERETADGKLSRKMSVLLWPPGAQKPVRFQSYCGGEDQRWQLAARFALSEVLLAAAGVDPSLEVLDEPSIHVSPRGVEELMVALRERAHRLGREIWVVEQHVLDENLFDGVLEVTKDADGSRVRWADRPAHGRIKDDPALVKEPA